MPACEPIRFTVSSVAFFERPVVLRMPFRFGVVTMTEAPQWFARVRIRLADGREATGMSAFMLAPKWFDKNPDLSNDDNFEQLRQASRAAAAAYTSNGGMASGFAHFANHYAALIGEGARSGLDPLVASFGMAVLDAACADALGRATGRSFYELAQCNALGIEESPLIADLAGFDFDAWLATLRPKPRLAARHTVGLLDPVAGHPGVVGDGLPESLAEVIARYGHRHFKLKVGGDVSADVARLTEIAAVLDTIGPAYMVSLDGNEQYENLDQLMALWERIRQTPALDRLRDSIRFIEQPIMRRHALSASVATLSSERAVIIDESDGTLDAFERAVSLGYLGVSSKLCKGLYKSIINAARCRRRNDDAVRAGRPGAFLMSGEDLTAQAGLAIQQDLALANLIGITDVERNGHHYVNGMGGAPLAEQQAFVRAHGDLYAFDDGVARLRIQDGVISVASLACAGFASDVHPQPD